MSSEADGSVTPQVRAKAEQVKRTIIWIAAVLMVLPLVLAWLTGALSF